MEAWLTAVFTLLGIAVGSFLNVCIDRLPAGRSLVYPPSRCDACQHRLSPGDLIPVLSYLWIRGRCRYCGAPVPRRVLMVEVLGGVIFFLAFWRYGLSPQFALTAFWSSVFLVIIFIDWEKQLILNKMTLPLALVALAILAVDSIMPGSGILGNLHFVPATSILSGIIGGAAAFLFFFIIVIINPRGMGMGDAKLAGLMGLVLGFPMVCFALLIGIVIGGVVAVILLATRKKGRKDVIPYGTFLGIGPIVVMLWGMYIYDWYMASFM